MIYVALVKRWVTTMKGGMHFSHVNEQKRAQCSAESEKACYEHV